MRYGEPQLYRSRRSSLQRLVIPGALAAVVASGAIGAATAYLASHSSSTAPAPRSTGTAVSSAPALARRSAGNTDARRHPVPVTAATTTNGPPTAVGDVATGQQLNDQGYALIQHGNYTAAIPLLRGAVADLRDTGPANPYEAYANYNLGYALLQSGDCTGALPPLNVARRLETSPLIGVAIRRAQACRPPGS